MKKNLEERWKKEGISERVILAFSSIRREDFVRSEDLDEAYGDYPLPIGHAQTISQPTTVVLMIDALDVHKNHEVLEVGAGSGYNAAILSRLCKKVIAIEVIPELVLIARENLRKAGITNVAVLEGDGSLGHPQKAPYDRIILTAAAPTIPPPLLAQLREGGKILAPVGETSQVMTLGVKDKGMTYRKLGYFTFVPLRGKHGF